MNDLARPLVVFDGECGFCRRSVERWRRQTIGVDFEPSQDVGERFEGVGPDDYARSVWYFAPSAESPGRAAELSAGVRAHGAEAVFRTLAHAPGKAWLLAFYRRWALFRALTEWGYRRVAERRVLVSRIDRAYFGTTPEAASFRIGSWWFLRGLALAYLCAFASLGVQIDGLVGSNGIVPAPISMANVEAWAERESASGWQSFPTLCWFDASDASLRVQCWAGAALAGLGLLGLVPWLVFPLIWLLYLSLVTIGNVFTAFQWDALLLETGLAACFLAPLRFWSTRARDPEPARLARWIVGWIVVRLMLFSGVVKVIAGGSWADLSALSFHLWTQPLPTPLAWFASQAPDWLTRMLCGLMFVAELILPCLLFLGRRLRHTAALGFIALSLGIAATGNYGFFNLLTIVLCLPFFDDQALSRLRGRVSAVVAKPPRAIGVVRGVLLVLFGAWVLMLTAIHTTRLCGDLFERPTWRRVGQELLTDYGAWRTVNSYGLFARMTEHRFEVEIQGSDDGETWTTYPLRWKPGAPDQAPNWVAPHMPRLDWQLWFAALNGFPSTPWFQPLCARLLEGSPEVLALFAESPFPDGPPRYVRAELWRYEFASSEHREATGEWWTRTLLGPYWTAQEIRGGGDSE